MHLLNYFLLVMMLAGCSDNSAPFAAGEDFAEWLPRGEGTDTDGEIPTELEGTDTDGEIPTELEGTDTDGEIPTELEGTDTDGEIPTELEDTDTDGEIPTELEDTCGLCPPMDITIPWSGTHYIECIDCVRCQSNDCYGPVIEICDGKAWSPNELPNEMKKEGCQYVQCCD